ncbi:MAG: hypothetical protein RMX96_04690 [Nostoc sp. ChiSLP02]|nr:hypothetical protein [Nostoc sp. DedSLP05]MDZ8102843.1 hypothetical protein [Nostoc sp. DedSLP01]MDZ8184146.1 hypothetical protein [Nostoc sp. ChiSLP02]
MNVTELVDELTQKGVKLWVDNDKLRIQSPKGILTPEIQTELAERKAEILSLLQGKNNDAACSTDNDRYLSLQTIGRLIGGFSQKTDTEFKPPVTNPNAMAQKLRITFRPLPKGYKEAAIIKFREQLVQKLQDCGVQIVDWESATKEMNYEITIPLTNLRKTIKTKVVKADVSAIIDVERKPNALSKLKICIAENLYNFYSQFIWKNQKQSVSKIAQFISWAEENIQPVEDPTNTQIIVLTDLDEQFISPNLPYQQKIPIGVNTLVRTFSEIVIGVSDDRISILNMNLSDSMFAVESINDFVLKSLTPKIYVPILPLPLSRFILGEYNPNQSPYAAQLVKFGQELASTELLPSGFKIDDVIKRKSHRDIVDWMANGRTGVSYGFVAYAEPPQYIGAVEISASEWENLSPIPGFSSDELRLNQMGRRYLKTKIGNEYRYKQIPDIWVISSRSGSKKTDLNLETDILRIGLQDKLLLQLPQAINASAGDIKPSYDLYVMVAIALSAALYAPELIENGAPMVHFHGYPSLNWFKSDKEYYTGVNNPSVPCGTYESGVFNFLGIYDLVQQYGSDIALAGLIEPDHGTNLIARNCDYLLSRIKTGIEQGEIELGGKYFPSLKQNVN